ncbi:GSK3B-interacting protein-like [Diorhabda carinulata]|uniref:GSK3B-interacting protein-like n=1 Tax=Diorhabda sublineata TaxID=1163346 RepID=UPI0024E15409|nr:GSK3B-interacting protein-like [Diorhabda sublineata]XP_056638237.1 GSK3B-interacting protein-like [Diorhabda sublineata]XP_057655212.1 GSK3B-interacting protein-like [Diorhabda carinulata]
MTEYILDSESWKLEAEAIINDVKAHVNQINISEKIPSSNSCIYMNLRTKEEKKFCIQLSSEGFKIVGLDWDENNLDSEQFFETPYSLLNSVSPSFSSSFASAVCDKLNHMC